MKYGWKPDIPDQRDYKLTAASKCDSINQWFAQLFRRKEYVSTDLRSQCPAVYDQGSLGSCTANAIRSHV